MTTSPTDRLAARRLWTRQALSLLVAAACLLLAFRRVDLGQLRRVLAGASLAYVALSALLNVAMTLVKCTKIGVLVRPVRRLRFRSLFAAETVSVLVDTAFPLRLNELVAAYVISRAEGVSAGFQLGAEFVMKVVEVLLLAALVLLLGQAVAFPAWTACGAWVIGGGALAAAGVLAAVAGVPHRLGPPLAWLARQRVPGAERAAALLREAVAGASRTAARPRVVGAVLLLTLVEWGLLAAALWSAARAVGVPLPAVPLLGLLVANHLAFAMPSSTSGSIGIYEVAGTTMLVALFGYAREPALAAVLVAHVVMLATGSLSGLVGLHLAHVPLRELHREVLALAGRRGGGSRGGGSCPPQRLTPRRAETAAGRGPGNPPATAR